MGIIWGLCGLYVFFLDCNGYMMVDKDDDHPFMNPYGGSPSMVVSILSRGFAEWYPHDSGNLPNWV